MFYSSGIRQRQGHERTNIHLDEQQTKHAHARFLV